jgi:predicted ATPase
MRSCGCTEVHTPRLIALTGGPGAGKTAVLELVRHHACEHLVVLPEAATIVFGGGFPRRDSDGARCAAQRAIAHVQTELERMELDGSPGATVVCDRGVVDGVAYWPGEPETFFADLGTTRAAVLRRYAAVIHLRTPPPDRYNHQNHLRIESAREAARIDERIVRAWAGHPRRFFVESEADFITKATRALELLRAELPLCCRIGLADAVALAG